MRFAIVHGTSVNNPVWQPNISGRSKFKVKRSPTSLHVWAAFLTRGNNMTDKVGDTPGDKMGKKIVETKSGTKCEIRSGTKFATK
jgi:hypothetical protein